MSSELDPGHAVAVDAATRDLLVGQGLPAERTVPLDPRPVGPHVLVLPASGGPDAARSRDGSAVVTGWVDAAGRGVEVRRPLPPPDEVARAGAERARFGSALSDNPRLEFAPEVRDLLRGGAVDPRLMVLLAGLAGSLTIGVGELPAAPGGVPEEGPHRAAVITTVDGAPTTDAAAGAVLQDLVAGQNPPFRPEVLARTSESLWLIFLSPSPLTAPSG